MNENQMMERIKEWKMAIDAAMEATWKAERELHIVKQELNFTMTQLQSEIADRLDEAKRTFVGRSE